MTMEHLVSEEQTQFSKQPKKRRLRACDSCRQRKIRCDNLPGSCRNCQTYGDECVITRDGKSYNRSTRSSPFRPYINKSSASRSFSKSDHDRPVALSRGSHSPEPSPSSGTYNPTILPQQETTGPVESFADLMDEDDYHRAENFTSGGATTEPPAGLPIFDSPSVSIDTVHGVVTTEVGRFPRNSKFAGLSSPQVFAKSAEEHFKGIAPHINVMEFFCPTMSFAEELPHQPTEHSPLVVKEIADICIQRFLNTYNQLFPILNCRTFCDAYLQFYDTGKCSDSAAVSCFFFAIALGSEDEEIGDIHFQAACKLQGDLLARPYISSVQALILMTLCLINTGRDSQALLTIGTAARIAQSIGLHRSLSAHNHPHEFQFVMKEHHLRSCIWWVCYCLDKKLSFELGRPSAICDDDCDADLPDISQVFTPSIDPAPETETTKFLVSLISLCTRLSTISGTLFHINTLKLDEKVIISRVVEADRHLQEWQSSLSPGLSPEQDLDDTENELQAVASSLLNCMYLNALVVVHRFSLISRNRSIYLITHPKRHAVASEKICSGAAHSLAHATSNLITEQRDIPVPRWVHPYAINTVIALFILIMRSPRKWSRDVDIALLWSMRHCFQSREDITYADRFDKLVDSLIRALEIPITGQQQTAARHLQGKRNSSIIGLRPATLDYNGGTGDQNTQSPNSQAFGPFHDGGSTVLASSATREGPEADGYVELLGDYAYLGNFQLWPVAPLYEMDQLDANRGSC